MQVVSVEKTQMKIDAKRKQRVMQDISNLPNSTLISADEHTKDKEVQLDHFYIGMLWYEGHLTMEADDKGNRVFTITKKGRKFLAKIKNEKS